MTAPRWYTRLAVVTALALLAACTTDPTTPSGPANGPPSVSLDVSVGSTTDRHIVAMAPGLSTASTTISAVGGSIVRSLPEVGVFEVSGLSDAQAQALRSRTGVVAVGRDFRQQFIAPLTGARLQDTRAVRTQGTDQSGAFFYPRQWNLHRIESQAAWGLTPGGAGALVCVLDSGVDPGQVELLGNVNLAKSASMIAAEPFIEDLNGHGTLVSSLVTANGVGMASVAPDGTLCAVKVLDQTGSGSLSDILAGIVFAANQGADVINMSLRGFIDISDPNGAAAFQVFKDVVNYARQKGALVIAATGNDALDVDLIEPFRVIPAGVPGVIGVSATKQGAEGTEAIAPYSNIGNLAVDLTAPGGDFNPANQFDFVLGACSRYVCGADNFYLLASGTSLSAPHVAGAAALAESRLAGNQSEEALRVCVSRGVNKLRKPPTKAQGLGRINARLSGLC